MIPVLALSIPICTLSEHGIVLPIFAIAAAGVATPCVWYFGGKREGTGRSKENQRLQERIKELEERLANVETISRFEMQLAAREREQLWKMDGVNRSLSHLRPGRAKKKALKDALGQATDRTYGTNATYGIKHIGPMSPISPIRRRFAHPAGSLAETPTRITEASRSSQDRWFR